MSWLVQLWGRTSTPIFGPNSLGNALVTLGERDSGTARLKCLVAAYRAALDVLAKAGAPQLLALAQRNLARVLKILDEREPQP